MGKSGHIAGKIAATLASTGTPAFFMHPAEASHGDLGMITRDDVVLAISNSGETAEVAAAGAAPVKRLGVPLIAMTGNAELDAGARGERAPRRQRRRGSLPAQPRAHRQHHRDARAWAMRSPSRCSKRAASPRRISRARIRAAALGRRLLLHVADVMRTGDALPRSAPDAPLREGLLEMSRKGLGMTRGRRRRTQMLGVFTDGDLRRALDRGVDVHTHDDARGHDLARQARSARRELAAEAVHLMEKHRITALPVVDERGALVGALNVHDLLRAGVV